MSLLAGIFSLDPKTPIPAAAVEQIRGALSRRDDPVAEFRDARLFLAKVDLGAFGEEAFRSEAPVACLTGEPLRSPARGRVPSRRRDLDALARAVEPSDLAPLRECQGSFSLCRYDPVAGTLVLATDRAGVRPVYFHIGSRHLVFASCLRVLEAIAMVPRRLDLRGVTEQVVLGFPLGDRTPYADVRVLRGGEALLCAGVRARVRSYWHWRDVSPAVSRSRKATLREAYEVFLDAVEARSARDDQACGFLSGGLDARVVVGALRALGKETHTLTFETPGLKDAVLARRLAERLGTHHVTKPRALAVRQRTMKETAASHFEFPAGDAPRFPSLIFTGDGGSVGLGFVYMDDAMVEGLRAGRLDETIDRYLGGEGLPVRAFQPAMRTRLAGLVRRGVLAELLHAATGDPARDFHVFLMDNDQRRHLHHAFEDLDVNRTEFLTPFFDGRLLELVASAPMDWFLHHRFYNDWLACFPAAVREVPWQAYPGHVPCPIPDDGAERTQWQRTRGEKFASGARTFAACRRSLFSRLFPAPILRRSLLVVPTVLHGLRLKDYSYLWDACEPYQTYFARCGGEIGEGDASAD